MVQKSLLSFFIFLLASSALYAQGSFGQAEDAWEVSFGGGVGGSGSGTHQTPVEGCAPRNVGLSFARGYSLNVRLTQNVGEHFGGEVEYALTNLPGVFSNLDPALPELGFSHKFHTLSYSGLVYATERDAPMRPYVSGGLGVGFFRVSDSSRDNVRGLIRVNLDRQSKFAFSVGGGVKFKVRHPLGLRVDVRDYITGIPDYDLSGTIPAGLPPIKPRGVAFTPDGIQHNWTVSIGLSLYLPIQ